VAYFIGFIHTLNALSWLGTVLNTTDSPASTVREAGIDTLARAQSAQYKYRASEM
jgi:hypothetical protein